MIFHIITSLLHQISAPSPKMKNVYGKLVQCTYQVTKARHLLAHAKLLLLAKELCQSYQL